MAARDAHIIRKGCMVVEFKAIAENGWDKLLSATGRGIELPQGIFYWSGRARTEADINATIGTARGKASDFLPGGDDKFTTFYLPAVREKLSALSAEQIFEYAPILGTPGFRDKWRKWIISKLHREFEFDESLIGSPMVVPGVSPGISYLTQLFLSPGEAIVCPDKRWENYDLIMTGCLGVKVDSFKFFEGGKPAPQNLEKQLVETAKKQDKLVAILNFPNNPTGYMPTRAEAEGFRDAVLAAAKTTGKKIVVIFDDAYDGFTFEADALPTSPFGMFIGLHENIVPIKADGVSKEFLWYGGRTAAATFALHPDTKDRAALEKEIENKLGALVRGTVSNSPRPVQEAVSLALDEPERIRAERETVRGVLAARCAKMRESIALLDPAAASPDPFNAGFFCLLNVAGVEAEKLADHLLKKYRVGIIPITDKALGINAVRVAFCSVDVSMIEDLTKAIRDGIADLA